MIACNGSNYIVICICLRSSVELASKYDVYIVFFLFVYGCGLITVKSDSVASIIYFTFYRGLHHRFDSKQSTLRFSCIYEFGDLAPDIKFDFLFFQSNSTCLRSRLTARTSTTTSSTRKATHHCSRMMRWFDSVSVRSFSRFSPLLYSIWIFSRTSTLVWFDLECSNTGIKRTYLVVSSKLFCNVVRIGVF